MKLAFSTKQKTKIAILLFGIMICTLLVRFLEDRAVKEMGKAFASIYNDRLVPATDLFSIAENLLAKQALLETHFNNPQKPEDLKDLGKQLMIHNSAIDSLLTKYEHTFLVAAEQQYLIGLKKNLNTNRSIENQLIQNQENFSQTQTKAIYHDSLHPSFLALANNLSHLTKIQSVVGEELIREAKSISAGSQLYSSIQLILSILIGILIIGILSTSNVIKINSEKFNLN